MIGCVYPGSGVAAGIDLMRQELARRGWSNQDLVDQLQNWAYRQGQGTLGLTRSYVSEWLSGKRGVGRRYAQLLGHVLGIPSELFIDGRSASPPRSSPIAQDEKLWLDLQSRPEGDDDIRRRRFLTLMTTLAGTPALLPLERLASVLSAGPPSEATGEATERECARWMAWEMWERKTFRLHESQLPAAVARTLARSVRPGSRLIARDDLDCYSFAHDSFVDFFVAERVFDEIATGKSNLLARVQTSHDTDQIIRYFKSRVSRRLDDQGNQFNPAGKQCWHHRQDWLPSPGGQCYYVIEKGP
jgi:transcriptional regulator with XRE-family HTH domain